MEKNKIATYLGFAIKSGAIVYGADNVEICKKKLFVVLIEESINRTSFKRVSERCERYAIELIVLNNELGTLVNKDKCKCVAVTDKNLASAIINEYKRSV